MYLGTTERVQQLFSNCDLFCAKKSKLDDAFLMTLFVPLFVVPKNITEILFDLTVFA
jgi:hypothetical protein